MPEEEDRAKTIKKAMEAIEEYKPELRGILPQEEYFRLTRTDGSDIFLASAKETNLKWWMYLVNDISSASQAN